MRHIPLHLAAGLCCCALVALGLQTSVRGQTMILDPSDYAHYVDDFNAMEDETVVNLIPNAQAWDWMVANVPLFDCPSARFEETYYFRWWTYRKHIRQTPDGLVLTEFLTPVKHAGPYNTIFCAYGHHVAEGRWLRDQRLLDDYTHYWYRSGQGGGPASNFRKFSSWAAAALWNRYLVTRDKAFLVDLLEDLAAEYAMWEADRRTSEGLFWQYDVRDGMEESISGSRTDKNIRPTINSYMAANAQAISRIAALAGHADVADAFAAKAKTLRKKMIDSLWDPDAKFFKVRFEKGGLSDAREEIGFIPWMFNLAEPEQAVAWRQIKDPRGFWAPWGLTTAERRHPKFRTHGTGTCEWDGAVWPFATSQTLTGLANLLHGPAQPYVTKRDYFEQILTYARAHVQDGKAYIGEYQDETTGKWLIAGPKAERSRYYNHSTFADLVITGLVGLVPREDDVVEVDPLIPSSADMDDPRAKKKVLEGPPYAWDWFCLDGVPYHGHSLTIVWDRTGNRYGRGAGLAIWADGKEIARSPKLGRLTGTLPESADAGSIRPQ
jgi:hypothetical protein